MKGIGKFFAGGICFGVVQVYAQAPSYGDTAARMDWSGKVAVGGLIFAALAVGVWWVFFRNNPSNQAKANTVVADESPKVEAFLRTALEEAKKDAAEGWDHVVAFAHKAHDTAHVLATKLPDPAGSPAGATSVPQTRQNAPGAALPAETTSDTAKAATAAPESIPAGAIQSKGTVMGKVGPYTVVPDNPTRSIDIEAPSMVRYFTGAQEGIDGKPLDPPTPPAHDPSEAVPWTTIETMWSANPAWGTGPESWEKAYAAAKAASAPGQARSSLPLPAVGTPDDFVVVKYLRQSTLIEKARFYSDNQQVLDRYRYNLPDATAALTILGRNTGSLLQATYDANLNLYFLNGRPLSSYTLEELGLDK